MKPQTVHKARNAWDVLQFVGKYVFIAAAISTFIGLVCEDVRFFVAGWFGVQWGILVFVVGKVAAGIDG